jgi:MFS transporter, PPP family, 3-phenylpropionic acid transporter
MVEDRSRRPDTHEVRQEASPGDASGPLPRYLLLYVALYAGWGVLSPFLSAVLHARGATAEEIGLMLAAGVVVRLVATPAAGALADRLGAPRGVLAALLLASAALGLGYGLAPAGLAALLLVGLAHHAATGPLGPLPDALAVRAAARGGIDYGVVRGAGAAAFIAGTLLAGGAVAAASSPVVVLWLNAGLFALAAGAALLLPPPPAAHRRGGGAAGRAGATGPPLAGMGSLLAIPAFRRLLLVAGLVSGSHAFYAGFATLRWQAAGLAPETVGLLWAVAVAAEVVVFFLLGRLLLARLGPGGLSALAAAAGALRWAVMAVTAWPPAMFLVQPLHGLTFAALHLAAMAVLARAVPGRLAATAQSVYTSLGTGLAGAALTLASGPLYARLGAGGFWAMALLCAAAVPAALALRADEGDRAEAGAASP